MNYTEMRWYLTEEFTPGSIAVDCDKWVRLQWKDYRRDPAEWRDIPVVDGRERIENARRQEKWHVE